MEQKPIHAAAPLHPPAADVARAYLDEAGAVEQRREARIDRRMLGWLHMIDGIVVGALFSAALFVMRSNPPVRYLWLLAILALVIWMEFAGELRDRLGVRPHWFRSWSLPYLLVFIPTMIIAWSSSLTPHPSVFLVVVPLGISVLVFGALAARQWWRARGQDYSGAIAEPEPFTPRAAVATAVIGGMLGVLIVIATGAMEPTAGTVIAGILLFAFLVFTIAVQTGSWVPLLGRIWLWPQWAALVIAGAVFLASLVLGVSTPILTLTAAVLTGAFVTLLFVVTAVWGLRRSSMPDPPRDGSLEGSS